MERKKTNCPCCKKLLFALGATESEGLHADSLKLETDSSGKFMTCRSCDCRISFSHEVGDQGQIMYRVSDVQECQDGH